MPPPSKNQSFLSQISKQVAIMRRQRPMVLPLIVIAALILCFLIYVIVPSSSQSINHVASLDGELPDLKLHPVRNTLANDARTDDEPVIDEKELSDVMKKSLERARKRSDDIPSAALVQLRSELDAAIAAKRFERCAIIRDVMQEIEKQIAEKVTISDNSVDDYIGRIEHSLRAESTEQSNQSNDQSTDELQTQQEFEEQSNDIASLRQRINALEEEARIKHRVRMLANRAKNSRIKIGRLGQEDQGGAGIRSNDDDQDVGMEPAVQAGVRSVDPHKSHEEEVDDRAAARAGIFPKAHDKVGDRVGMKAGIHAGDNDGNRHHRSNGFASYEEAKQAAEAAKSRRRAGRHNQR